jgi:hypothetical protein
VEGKRAARAYPCGVPSPGLYPSARGAYRSPPEDALVDPAQRVLVDEMFQALDAQGELAESQRPLVAQARLRSREMFSSAVKSGRWPISRPVSDEAVGILHGPN